MLIQVLLERFVSINCSGHVSSLNGYFPISAILAKKFSRKSEIFKNFSKSCKYFQIFSQNWKTCWKFVAFHWFLKFFENLSSDRGLPLYAPGATPYKASPGGPWFPTRKSLSCVKVAVIKICSNFVKNCGKLSNAMRVFGNVGELGPAISPPKKLQKIFWTRMIQQSFMPNF